jgi:hypothetical protein
MLRDVTAFEVYPMLKIHIWQGKRRLPPFYDSLPHLEWSLKGTEMTFRSYLPIFIADAVNVVVAEDIH